MSDTPESYDRCGCCEHERAFHYDVTWMHDCIDAYLITKNRPPTTAELLAWREADASCRMERES